MPDLTSWIERAALGMEALAVVLIVGFATTATVAWLRGAVVTRGLEAAGYERYRRRLGRSLLLGLEILVGADIIHTVAVDSTLPSVVGLGLLVLVRTFLSWSIVLEIEGRWPWSPRPAKPTGERI